MGVRWYDPALGRFTQPDSIVPGSHNSGAWDRFSYSFNNPLKFVDPTGHSPDCWDDEYSCDEPPDPVTTPPPLDPEDPYDEERQNTDGNEVK